MRKKAALAVLIVITAALLGGCWNYRGLDEMTIVTGVAIDREPGSDLYHLSFEYVDLSGPVKQQGIKAAEVEATGVTLFDAARNVKKRTTNKLYFGHMETVVLNEEVARSTDISSLIDFILRDAECRETMCVTIAQGSTAQELLSLEGIGQPMEAYELHQIVKDDQRLTSSTVYEPIFQIYDTLNSQGIELTLPVFHRTHNNGKPTNEANGIAVYKGERLVGFLSPEESKNYLFATDQVKGGIITCSGSGEGPDDASLEIYKSNTKTSFRYRDGQLTMRVETEIVAYLGEMEEAIDVLDRSSIQRVEASAAQKVMRGMSDVIQRVRTEYGSDIFGFGNKIFKRDFKLWQQLKDNWNEMFVTMPVDITCSVRIINTTYLKK